MKAKQVCKLQENLAKEAIAYLMLYGTAVDVTPYRKAVTQVGTAWGLPIPDTQRWLDLIRQEEIAVTQAANPEKVNHVMEEKDLPIKATKPWIISGACPRQRWSRTAPLAALRCTHWPGN